MQYRGFDPKEEVKLVGHVVRRGENSHVYRSYKEEFLGKRPSGTRQKRWADQIRQGMNLPLITIERTDATDRDRWQKCVIKICQDLKKIIQISQVKSFSNTNKQMGNFLAIIPVYIFLPR